MRAALKGKGAQESWKIFTGYIILKCKNSPDTQKDLQMYQETCLAKQESPDRAPTHKGSTQGMEIGKGYKGGV